MTEPTSYRDYIRRQAERFRESQRQVEEFIHRHALLTPRQDAPVWPLETLSGVIAGMQSPEGATGVQAGAQRLARMTADTATDDGLDALYAELDDLRAEVEHWRSGGGDRYDTFVPWTVCEAMHHQLEQKVAAVAALHVHNADADYCEICADHGDIGWPCATIHALNPQGDQ